MPSLPPYTPYPPYNSHLDFPPSASYISRVSTRRKSHFAVCLFFPALLTSLIACDIDHSDSMWPTVSVLRGLYSCSCEIHKRLRLTGNLGGLRGD